MEIEDDVRTASRRTLHAVADAHAPRLSVAFRFAFAAGRKAIRPLLPALRDAELRDANCGTGAGGFQPGNTCASGDGLTGVKVIEGARHRVRIESDQGFITLLRTDDPEGQEVLIGDILVKEGMRGKGYGTAIYERALDYAISKGAKGLTSTGALSADAKRMWAKFAAQGRTTTNEDGDRVLLPRGVKSLAENCGTGAGGFQPGNTCAKGSGGISEVTGVNWSSTNWGRDFSEPDDFYYHVTLEPAAKRILDKQELAPGRAQFMGRAEPAEHSSGRVFLTDRNGVFFWAERVEQHAQDKYDDPPAIKVLRIPKSAVPNARPDPAGTRDAKAPAYYVDGPVKLRSAEFNPDQPRDEHGRWTSGSGFSDDISDRYPIINEMRAYDERDAKRVRSQLRQKGRLNEDGTTSLYHVTLSDPDSITERGLIPAYERAAGQDWQAQHSSYATYFFLDKDHAIDQVEQSGAGAVIEARIPITGQTLSRFVPDEDSSLNIHDGVKTLVEGGAVAFIGGVPPSAVRIVARRGLASNCGTGAGGFQPGNTCAKGSGDPAPIIDKRVFHGGVGEHGAAVTYYTANRKMAESYVQMSNDRFGTGGSLHETTITIEKPADENIIRREAARVGIDNGAYTPASVFDENLHGEANVRRLVEGLRRLGYDGAVLDDIGYGVQIEDKAFIKFEVLKTAAENCGTGAGGFQLGNTCAKGSDGTDAWVSGAGVTDADVADAAIAWTAARYPRAGLKERRRGGLDPRDELYQGEVDGLRIRTRVPNTDSIGAQFADSNEYDELPGIREVSLDDFDDVAFGSADDERRVEDLARAIAESGEITPLIVIMDGTRRPWVLEGGHRLPALKRLGKTKAPAVVIVDHTAQRSLAENCGTGAGGFQPGNTCAKGNSVSQEARISAHEKLSRLPDVNIGGYDGVSTRTIFKEPVISFVTKRTPHTVETVSLEGLTPTQDTADRNSIQHFIDSDSIPEDDDKHLPKIAVFEDGRKVVLDGHHRLIADILLGKTSVSARVVHMKARGAAADPADVASRAVTQALSRVLPPMLLDAMADGGDYALGALPRVRAAADNCGTGAGGFQPGNTCSKGGGSVDDLLDAPLPHDEWRNLPADPEYFYHATNVENVDTIADGELETHDPLYGTDQEEWPDGSTQARSYFTDKPSTAWQFAPEEGRPVLLRVRRDAVLFKRESTGDYYTTKKIPAEKLTGVTKDKTWVSVKRTLRTGAAKLKHSFNREHKAAVAWAKQHAAELVTDVSETTRRRIRSAVAGLAAGEDWNEATERILAAVGDEDRAELIARHETMTAASEGQRRGWAQAAEDGLLDEAMRRTWITTPDERLCPICETLDGTVAEMDGEYPGGYLGPPAHVQCRCTEGLTA